MKKNRCKTMKRITSSVMVTIFISFTLFTTGCGNKAVDYGEESVASSGYAKGELAKQLEIPASYIGDLSTEGTDLAALTINDKNIEVPDVDCMYIAYYRRPILDEEYKQKILEGVTDQDKDIYQISDTMYKEDAQYVLDYEMALFEEAKAAGDTEWIDYYSSSVEAMERMVNNASLQREKITDYKEDSYQAYLNGRLLSMHFLGWTYDGEVCCDQFDVTNMDYDLLKYKQEDLGIQLINTTTDADEYGLENRCEMTLEEAESFAIEYFANLGLTDLVLAESHDLLWQYRDYAFEVLDSECNGYHLIFSVYVDGQPIYFPMTMLLEPLKTEQIGYDIPRPEYTLQLDDKGVVGVDFENPIEIAEKGQERVDIISFEEALEVLEAATTKYYSEHPSSYNKITFNDVKLTYYMIADPEEKGLLKVVPVYVFAQNNTDPYGEIYENNPEELFVINAVDGSVINVIEELENMNVYSYTYW